MRRKKCLGASSRPTGHGRVLTWDGRGESGGVVQKPLPELVAADAGRTHQHERPPLAGLRVVERHLLVRRRLAAAAAAAAQLQRRAVPLALVGLPRAQQRGRAGLPRARRHLLLLQRLVTSLLSKYLIVQKIFDNALKIFAHLVPLLPLQRHAVLLQGEAGHEAGEGLGPLAVPVGLPPVRVILADHVQDVATLRAEHQLFSLFIFLYGNFWLRKFVRSLDKCKVRASKAQSKAQSGPIRPSKAQ